MDKEFKDEMDKSHEDVKRIGLGIFDMEGRRRVNPETLAFSWPTGKAPKAMEEVVLQRNFAVIKKVYKEKFGNDSPYDLELFKKDEGLFVERLIRAVEICTMGYVLNDGKGTLNLNLNPTIVKGRKRFIWED